MQSDEIDAPQGSDLRAYLHVLSRRKWIIVLVAVLCVGLSLAYSLVKTPVYSVSATVLVPEQQPNSALNIQNSFLPASDVLIRELSDDAQFARGDTVKFAAAKILGYAAGASVGTSVTADVITFTASSTDKAAAAQIANAYANAFIVARRANQVNQYTQQITALESSIAGLQAQEARMHPGNSQLPALRSSIESLSQTVQQTQAASQVAGQVGPTVIKAAVPPTSPSSPRTLRNAILALIAGLIIGVGVAFLVERLDDGINSREAAEAATRGLPIVGLIPLVDAWKSKGSHHLALVEDPTSSVSEAYRTLRTAIQFLGLDEPKRVIAVTSAVPDEGKTTVVANLALSFARAGQRVIVVSCDLRRPKLHDFFGDKDRSGLTTVLLGQCTLSEGVHAVKDEPRLRVMPSGPVPPNPAEILSLDRVKEIVNLLADNSDLVLIDCPPVLPVTDALLLSRLADGVLVLAAAKSTSKRDLRRTIELLRQVHAPLLGVVLNRVPLDGGYAYGYGYGYYGKYDTTEEPSTNGTASAFETLVAHATTTRSAPAAPPASAPPDGDGSPSGPADAGRLYLTSGEGFDQ
jgi:capsular exopolysaccharide synthesis family protein